MGKIIYPPPPPTPETGKISIAGPIALLLEESIGVQRFIKLATTGKLDYNYRNHKFHTSGAIIRKAQKDDPSIPDSTPEMEGYIAWRKKLQCWQVDIEGVDISEDIRWWECLKKGSGNAKIRIKNAQIPEVLIAQMIDRPISEVVEHRLLTEPRITINKIKNYKPGEGWDNKMPACVEIFLSVPRVTIDRDA
jgi:hypothetical protein